jgi:hypothetical protein
MLDRFRDAVHEQRQEAVSARLINLIDHRISSVAHPSAVPRAHPADIIENHGADPALKGRQRHAARLALLRRAIPPEAMN